MALDQNVRLVFDKINNAKKRSPHNQNVELIAATKQGTFFRFKLATIWEFQVLVKTGFKKQKKNLKNYQVSIL